LSDLHTVSAVELARRIRDGELSPVRAVDAHIARIEAVDRAINAVVVPRFADARREARNAAARIKRTKRRDRLPPFLGVPCTVKELLAVEGMPWTAGVVARRHVTAPSDGPLVQRLRGAGGIVLGLTNVSEAGLWLESENPIYGRTNNPHDVTRMAGGSSGGEAAIIAAGGSPMGIGADIGGSIRNPSFFNGICGHKPTGGLLPSIGHWPPAEGQRGRYCVSGPMARTVEDMVAMMEVFSPEDDPHRDPGRGPFRRAEGLRPEDITVHWFESNGMTPADDEVRADVRRTADGLAGMGFRVEEWRPPGMPLSFALWLAKVSSTGDPSVRELLGNSHAISLRRELANAFFGRSRHSPGALFLAALDSFGSKAPGWTRPFVAFADRMRERIEARLGDRGVLLCPVYPRAAPRHRRPLLSPLAFAYCGVFNILEMPATAVPTGPGRDGLPLGLQVAGPRFSDALTLYVAEHIERWSGGCRIAPAAPLRRERS